MRPARKEHPRLQLAVLSELPDSFTTAEGVAIAGKCGMPERSFKRFLKDRKGVLFTRTMRLDLLSKPRAMEFIPIAEAPPIKAEQKFPNELRNFRMA